MRNIGRVNTWVSTGLENGLFKIQNDVSYEEIREKLRKAEEYLEKRGLRDKPDFVQSGNELDLAAKKYYSALQKTTMWWRLKNVYAIHLFLYLVTLLSVIFVLYNSFQIDSLVSRNLNVPILAVYAVTWGVIGSVLRGFWALWTRISDRSYRSPWFIWFLSIPFIGGLLGAMVYFVIFAGVIIASSESTIDDTSASSLNPLVVIVLCGFAGFNWQWALEQLDRLKSFRQ